MITVGYGDIGANTVGERLMAIVAMFAGVIFFSLTISFINSLLSEIDLKRSTETKKMEILNEVRYISDMSDELFRKVRKKVISDSYRDDDDLISLSSVLPTNIALDLNTQVYSNRYNHFTLFQNLPAKAMGEIGPQLVHLHFTPNERIFIRGECANEVFVIKRGVVSMILEEFDDKVCWKVKERGYFGEIECIYGCPRHFTYKADSELEVWSLELSVFTDVFFKKNPKIGMQLKNGADQKFKEQQIISVSIANLVESQRKSFKKVAKLQKDLSGDFTDDINEFYERREEIMETHQRNKIEFELKKFEDIPSKMVIEIKRRKKNYRS